MNIYNKQHPLRVVTLCSGYDSQCLALRYLQDEHPDFDLLTYSTPCQSVSNAGLRKGIAEGSGTRSSLLWYTRNAILAKHPKFLLMENVKGLTNEKFRPFFLRWLSELESYGYNSFYRVLNAKDYGVPKNRERIFVVSILRTPSDPDPQFHFPSPIPLQKTVEDVVEDEVPDRYFLKSSDIDKFCNIIDVDEYIQQIQDP